MSTSRLATLILCAVLFAGWFLVTGSWPSVVADEAASNEASPPSDPLAADEARGLATLADLGVRITGGAAPGYLEDRACTPCHAMIAETYREVGMARSFVSARDADRIEDFDAEPYFHAPSGRYYQMRETADGGLRFRRWQIDGQGREVHALEQDVDWVMGSGHTSRVYLYATPSGELFQLPLAWYSQGQHWRFAPGQDRARHDGVSRIIRRECMFCHNAYPDAPAGSDAPWASHTFPDELPHGTGCQRCHGPGARHAALTYGGAERQEIIDAIVAPKRLAADRSRDICYTCHMQPAVAMMPVRRFGRADYSQRPGDPLSDYLVQTDAEIEGVPKPERFEINHHPYRMEQSACFIETLRADGTSSLSCLTCHDPHRKVPAAERAAHYRRACTGCHAVTPEKLAAMRDKAAATDGFTDQERVWFETQDCAGCHMPRRRTQDVIHVVMTDHKITRLPDAPTERLAPLTERHVGLTTIEFLRPDEAPAGDLGEIHRVRAVLQAGGGAEALDRLNALLERTPVDAPEVWLAKVRAELGLHRYAAAEKTIGRLLGMLPEHPQIYRYWGLARAGQGQADTAIALVERAVELDPTSHESVFNLGVLLSSAGRPADAEPHLRRAITLRPHAAPAHRHLGQVLLALDRPDEAETAFRQALAAEPSDGGSTIALGRLLLERGDRDAALRALRHGMRWARRPDAIRAVLDSIEPVEAGP
ncbi:MAG: tetratricopeptide repeat protein [Acidobacteriota bacterium]